jgi:hypothetical protein
MELRHPGGTECRDGGRRDQSSAGTSGTGTPPRPGDRQVPSAKTMTNAEFREALAKYGVKLPR